MFRNISVRTIAQSEHFTVGGYLTEAYICNIGGIDCILEQLLKSVIASLCFFSWPCVKKSTF